MLIYYFILNIIDTYEQAIERINFLKIKEFPYTTDPEINKNEKSKIIENQIISSYEKLTHVPNFTQEVTVATTSKAFELKDNKGNFISFLKKNNQIRSMIN